MNIPPGWENRESKWMMDDQYLKDNVSKFIKTVLFNYTIHVFENVTVNNENFKKM